MSRVQRLNYRVPSAISYKERTANSKMPDGLAYEEMVVGEEFIGFVVEYQYLKPLSTKFPKPLPLKGLQGRKLAGTGSGHGSRSACGGGR